jgi:NitT/TauT family transport system substrate-binding protein
MPGLHILANMETAEGARSVFGTESYLATVLYSKPEWLEENRDTAKKLASAIQRTLTWLLTHSPAEIREKLPASFRTEDAQTDEEALRMTQAMLSPDGKFTPEAVEAVHRVLGTAVESVRNAKIDLGKTYTNETVQ